MFSFVPPPAPKKKANPSLQERRRQRLKQLPKFELERMPEWEVLLHSGLVRPKYLNWTPKDVEVETDREELETLLSYYGFPSSQPTNMCEQSYCDIMGDAIRQKLASLPN